LPPGTYIYTATLPTVTPAVTIEPTTGTDPSATVVQASNTGHPRLFNVGTGGDLTLDALTLENAQTGPGSALQVTGASATLTNCVVTNNQATAMYVTGNGSLTVSGSTISSNPGTTGPGGIWIDFSNLVVSNTTFSGNTGALGGAAYISTANDLPPRTESITGSTFSGNTSANSGGALYISSNVVTIDASTFNGNATARGLYGGGAIYTQALGAGTVITNSTFTGNQANAATGGNGGAIFVLNRASCTGCTFSQNVATGNGGAVYAGANDGAEFDAVDSTFSQNEAVGGGAVSTGGASGTFKLASVTITKNLATGKHGVTNTNLDLGGGGGTNGTDIRARNTIVAGNQSPLGGADCEGQIMSLGYALVGDDTNCSVTASAGNQVGTGASPIDPASTRSPTTVARRCRTRRRTRSSRRARPETRATRPAARTTPEAHSRPTSAGSRAPSTARATASPATTSARTGAIRHLRATDDYDDHDDHEYDDDHHVHHDDLD
jgi:predicted outer membrane repeat protein